MNFDTNMTLIGGELRKLRTIEYCNTDGMDTAILNIWWGLKKKKKKKVTIKVVLLINLVYFGENDCLSLEFNIYKNLEQKYPQNPL